MTDRVYSLTVVLDKEYRTDDVQHLVEAIEMLRGVRKVELGPIADTSHYQKKAEFVDEFRAKILKLLAPPGRRAGRAAGRIPAMRRHPLSCSVRVKKLVEEAQLPRQMTPGSAGFDLHACIVGEHGKIGLAPGERTLVGTGIVVAIDDGYEGQVRPRSGIANKNGITLTNSPGTIDSDYRGEVKILLQNTGNTTFIVEHGDRIAQLVIAAVPRVEMVEEVELDHTERGERGFGSTGGS